MTPALTFKTAQATGDLDLAIQGRGHRRPAKATDDLGAATFSRTVAATPPGEQETITKATVRPRHAGQLVNHHCANGAVTTGTVASRHAMP